MYETFIHIETLTANETRMSIEYSVFRLSPQIAIIRIIGEHSSEIPMNHLFATEWTEASRKHEGEMYIYPKRSWQPTSRRVVVQFCLMYFAQLAYDVITYLQMYLLPNIDSGRDNFNSIRLKQIDGTLTQTRAERNMIEVL